MEMYGGQVVASPSPDTNYGRTVLAETPDNPGSLGIAISEAVEDAATRDDTKYALGSVLNHVLLHQTVIGMEAMEQMAMAGEKPDIIVACAGGGSNFAGLTFPFVGQKLRGEADYRIIAVEPEAAPSLTRGVYRYDFGDTGKMTPLVKMHTLGHDFIPEPIHAGGLRYHGMAPLVSLLKEQGIIEAQAVHQTPHLRGRACRSRARRASCRRRRRAHAISVVIDEAARKANRPRAPARSSSSTCAGHGHFDLAAYERYLSARWRTTSCRPTASAPRWRGSLDCLPKAGSVLAARRRCARCSRLAASSRHRRWSRIDRRWP